MKKDGEAWTIPVPLPEPINYVQEEGENWPSSNNNFFFTLDGETHYFTTMMRGSKAIEVYKTQLKDGDFSKPELIEGLFENDSLWKYSASISPDGSFLVFASSVASLVFSLLVQEQYSINYIFLLCSALIGIFFLLYLI